MRVFKSWDKIKPADVLTRRTFLYRSVLASAMLTTPSWGKEGSVGATKIGAVKSLLEFQVAMRSASLRNRVALIDVGADWCEFCAILDSQILTDGRITAALSTFALIRVDVTSMDDEARTLLSHLSVDGPPTLFVVETRSGREFAYTRSVGPINAEQLEETLRRVKLRVGG